MTLADFGINVRPNKLVDRITCPECSPGRSTAGAKKKCLTVWVNTNTWSCSHCGWNRFDALKKMGRSVADFAATNTPIEPVFQPVRLTAPQVEDIHMAKVGNPRGLSLKTLKDNDIRVTKERDGTVKTYFPYTMDGVLVNFKAKWKDQDDKKQFYQSPGGAQILYRLDSLAGHSSVILTEGEEDALSWVEIGFENAASVPGGAPGADDKDVERRMQWLTHCAEHLEGVDIYYLAFDADPPGRRLMQETSRRVGRVKCRIISFPEDCKDSNEVLVKHGPEALKACYANAQPYPEDGVFTFRANEADLDYIRQHGYPKGVGIGVEAIDQLIRWFPEHVTVFTGLTNNGKSGLVSFICSRMAAIHGWKIAFFTPEYRPRTVHQDQIMSMVMGKPFLPGFNGRMTDFEYDCAKAWCDTRFFYIHPDHKKRTIQDILEKAAYWVLKQGINALVIDPLNHIKIVRKGSSFLDLADAYGDLMQALREFAEKCDVAVFLVAHPNPTQKDAKTNRRAAPDEYDIKGMKEIAAYADNIVVVHLDKLDDPSDKVNKAPEFWTRVIVSKVKHKMIGRKGTAIMGWNRFNERYHEVDGSGVISWDEQKNNWPRDSWIPITKMTNMAAPVEAADSEEEEVQINYDEIPF